MQVDTLYGYLHSGVSLCRSRNIEKKKLPDQCRKLPDQWRNYRQNPVVCRLFRPLLCTCPPQWNEVSNPNIIILTRARSWKNVRHQWDEKKNPVIPLSMKEGILLYPLQYSKPRSFLIKITLKLSISCKIGLLHIRIPAAPNILTAINKQTKNTK